MKLRYVLVVLLLTACAPDTLPPATHYGMSDGGGSAGVHTVTPGETLYAISKRYQLPMQEIVYLNNLSAPFELPVGARLDLPTPKEYRVRRGDTLYTVSRLFDTTTTEIVQLNNLPPPHRLTAGQVIRLPETIPPAPPVVNAVAVPPVEEVPLSQSSITPAIYQPPPMDNNSAFMRPVDGSILSSFGAKEGGLHNDGINIRAARGTPVMAAENGIVAYNGNELKGYGNLILVKHDNGYITAYAHLDQTLVRKGDTVRRGQSIGTVGQSGQVSEPQLHFEIRKGTKALDPSGYI